MSFWAGLARAYKDVDEKNEREDVAEAQERRYQGDVDRAQQWRTEDLETAAANRAEDIQRAADEAAELRRQWDLQYGLDDRKVTVTETESRFTIERARTTDEQNQANWDKAYNYTESRDGVGDEQWAAEQIRIADESREARRQWQDTFDFSVSESEAAADRFREQFGFQQDRALSEDEWRDAMHLYSVSRDVVSDAQWDSQFEYTQDQAEAAEARFRDTHQLALDKELTDQEQHRAEMDWRKSQADTAAEQWAAEQDLRVRGADLAEEEVFIARAQQLMELGAGNLGGSDTTPSPADGEAAVLAIRSELEGVGGLDSLDEANQEFFNTVLGNPSAAAGLMSFVLEQREENDNVFEITRLPQVIDIVGVTAARGEEAYNAFKRNFAEGNETLSDPEAFLDAVRALRGYEPAEVLFVQSRPVRNLQDQERMYNVWEMATIQAANADLASMDKESPEYMALHTMLADSEDGNNRIAMRGFNNLWDTYGRAQAAALGLDNSNVRLKSFFANDGGVAADPVAPVVEPTVAEPTAVEPTVADPVVDTVVDPMVDPVVEEPTTDPYAAYPDIDRDFFFDTPDEALELMNTLPDDVKASIEFVVIGGEKFANNYYQPPVDEPTVEEPTVADPMVDPAVEPAVEPVAEPVDEATRQLNAVLEGEGIDPGEFQRFITQLDEVEGFQDMTDYESLITIFQRMKAKGQEWPEGGSVEPAPEVSPTRPRMRPEAEVVEEAPAAPEPEVEVEVPAEAPTLPEDAEATVIEAGVDLTDFYEFLMDNGFTANSSRVLPGLRPLITLFKRERG